MYVGDALSPAEREAVERLCAADEALQLELEAQKLLAAAVREGETLDPSVERSLAAMNARIDVYQQRRRWYLVDWQTLFERVGSFRPMMAAPVGALAVVLLTVWLWPVEPSQVGNTFNTATEPQNEIMVYGPTLRVKFGSDVDAEVRVALLSRQRLTVLNDSVDSVVLTVTAPVGQDLQKIADALQKESIIEFVTVRQSP